MNYLQRLQILFLFLGFSITVNAQDTIRVMQYNLLFYGLYTDFCTPENNNVSHKDEYLRTILGHFQPEIFAVNEMGRGAHNVTRLLDSVLNINGVDYFEHGTYTNSTNGWFANALYYDSRKFGLLHETVPSSTLRDINLYTLYYKSDDLHLTGDTTFLTLIVAHLKAGQSVTDQQMRTTMVTNVMNYLNTNDYSGNIMFIGDFNMRSSFEQAYQLMVANPNPFIRMHDPINVNGVWGLNSEMAPYHTQSPRTGSHPCFVTGGLDDRYDFILATLPIMEGTQGLQYIQDSYIAIGQDGIRYNQSLINPPNFSQPEEIISALYNMSDHLPVMMEMVTTSVSSNSEQNDFRTTLIKFTNPVRNNLHIEITSQIAGDAELTIYSLGGAKHIETRESIHAGSNLIVQDIAFLSAGVYVLSIKLPNRQIITRKIVKL